MHTHNRVAGPGLLGVAATPGVVRHDPPVRALPLARTRPHARSGRSGDDDDVPVVQDGTRHREPDRTTAAGEVAHTPQDDVAAAFEVLRT
jgi:hypothetical protein